jgi:hypothetical protein
MVSLALGLALLAGGYLVAQQAAQQAPDYKQGKIVKIDPDLNKIWIRSGDKEQEFAVDRTAKLYGLDQKALSEGLRSKDLRAGADVMYRMGPGNTGISELRLGTKLPPPPPK